MSRGHTGVNFIFHHFYVDAIIMLQTPILKAHAKHSTDATISVMDFIAAKKVLYDMIDGGRNLCLTDRVSLKSIACIKECKLSNVLLIIFEHSPLKVIAAGVVNNNVLQISVDTRVQ